MNTTRSWLARLAFLVFWAFPTWAVVSAIAHGREDWLHYVAALIAAAAITIAIVAVIETRRDARKPPPMSYAAGHLYHVDPNDPNTFQPGPDGQVFSTRLVHADECTSPGCPLVPYRKDPR